MKLLRSLLRLFTRREKYKIAGLFLLILVGATLETIGLGLLAPYVAFIGDPGVVERHEKLTWVGRLLTDRPHEYRVMAFGIAILGLYMAKNFFLVAVNALQNSFLFSKQVAISRALLKIYLRKPYTFHLASNSSDLYHNIGAVATVLQGILMPFFSLAVELTVIAMVLLLLFGVAPVPALVAIAMLGLPSLILFRSIQRKLHDLGVLKERHNRHATKWIHQSLGGVKEIKVSGSEDFFLSHYVESAGAYAAASARAQIFTFLPRLFIETVAVGAVVLLIFIFVFQKADMKSILPVLGLFVLSMGRIMPSLTRLIGHLAMIKHCRSAVYALEPDLEALREELRGERPAGERTSQFGFRLRQNIEFRELSFQYSPGGKYALDKVSFSVPQGASIGIVGPSGAGKTTIVDLLLGLLAPSSGGIYVDGIDIHSNIQGWQERIGYIPQTIYLLDDTIRRNIAFGVSPEKIDDERVRAAVKAACLEGFINGLPDGLDTIVGERGVRMSGGQRQRVGIARALYRDLDMLVLDEATSALDHETEQEVTQAIEGLIGKKTLIVIAHRLTTVKNCQRLYKIVDGRIVATGEYQEICGSTEV